MRVMTIEVSEPLPSIPHRDIADGLEYTSARVFVRLHTAPIGLVDIKLDGEDASPDHVAACIWQALSQDLIAHMQNDGIVIDKLDSNGIGSATPPACLLRRSAFLEYAPSISVVVATHNRASSLARTLDSLARLQYPSYEVIVVDNAPGNDDTRTMVATKYPTVHYVCEPQAGLAVAHNRGLHEVRMPIVAFTDDDVEVDPHWLTSIAEAFALDANVACVTGMILPAELQTPAQLMIEEYGYNKGFTLRVFDIKENRKPGLLYPYTAGVFGSGANMAFRTDVLSKLGGFDPALGAGSVAKGGDDLCGFFSVVSAGYKLVYQPASILRHWHRRDYESLVKQAYGYGVGLTAYLASVITHKPLRIFDVAFRVPFGIVHAIRLRGGNAGERAAYPFELTRSERRGMLSGPIAYLRSRRKCANLSRQNKS